MVDSDSAPAVHRNGALIFVIALVFIDMLGFGIIMPVLPGLIGELTGKAVGNAAVDAGWLAFAYALMQLIFAPIIGNLSDRYGRRPVMLAALVGYGGNYILMGLAPTLLWLYAGRIVAGIFGASFSTAYAYIADISTPEKRAQNFGLIGMAFGLGFIFGPALGGFLGEYGTRIPFYVAGGLALANAVLGFFLLKESLPPEKRRAFSLARANTISALRSLKGKDSTLWWYCAAYLAWMMAHLVYPAIWAFYGIAAFGWSERMVGLSLAFVGLSSAIVQGGLIRIIIPRIGEAKAITLGIALVLVSMGIYTVIRNDMWVWVALCIGALQGLVQPSLNALMSRTVGEDNQGELQGALSSLSGLASVIGPPLFAYVFAVFTTGQYGLPFLPGAPFALAGAIAIIALALFWRGYRQQRQLGAADLIKKAI